MKDVLLSVEDLSCGYGKELILHDMDFKVYRGELMCIIGPNGSGKSTLLRTISRILKPHRGKIFLDGKNITRMRHKEFAQKIAVVSQTLESTGMTVQEYILLGRLPYFRKYQFFETNNDEDIVQKYMKLTDALKLKETLMSEISGGERQLASIARALTQEPALLLLDEPSSGLSPKLRELVFKKIVDINELGTSLIIVEQNARMALAVSHRGYVLEMGKNRFEGEAKSLLSNDEVKTLYLGG